MTGADGRVPILDCCEDNLRVAIERRYPYAVSGHTAPVDFGRYFTNGLVDGVPMWTQSLGELNVPTGSIVACDPVYVTTEHFRHPFERRVVPGRYTVVASLADLGSWGERVAFSMLMLSATAPANWELAETALPVHAYLRSHYGVDAGVGLFGDLAAIELFARVQREFAVAHPQGNYEDEVLEDCFEGHSNWCDHRPDPASDLNTIIFRTGLGDGLYASYWGLGPAGEPVCLVTDFQLFDREGSILHADVFARRAIVTRSISEENKPIAYLYREEPDDDGDSGWRATAGEGQKYLDDVDNLRWVSLRELVGLDGELKDLLQRPVGCAFKRGSDGVALVPAEPPATH